MCFGLFFLLAVNWMTFLISCSMLGLGFEVWQGEQLQHRPACEGWDQPKKEIIGVCVVCKVCYMFIFLTRVYFYRSALSKEQGQRGRPFVLGRDLKKAIAENGAPKLSRPVYWETNPF